MSKKNISAIVSGAGWIGSFASLLVEELENLGVSFEDIHKLGKPTQEGRRLVEVCAKAIASEVNGRADWSQNKFLRPIYSLNNPLIIDPVDGSELIMDASDVFSYIDSDFKNWDVDERGGQTGATPVVATEMIKDGQYVDLFGSIFGAYRNNMEISQFIEQYRADLDRLCLGQAQVKGFVRKHRNWLRIDGCATFFLFKSRGQFFVAHVFVNSDGLEVYVDRFDDSYEWRAEYRHRLVTPQLA